MKIYKKILIFVLCLSLVLPIIPIKSFIQNSNKTLVINYKQNNKTIHKISYLNYLNRIFFFLTLTFIII